MVRELTELSLTLEEIKLDVSVLIRLVQHSFICSSIGLELIRNMIKFATKNCNTQFQAIDMIQQYKIIRTRKQYFQYCNILEKLVKTNKKKDHDDIELLTLVIKKWDEENLPKLDSDPIQLIKALMQENQLKATDLAKILEVNKSTVSRILSYQKGLSKNSIRILSVHFAIAQEALNQPYKLKNKINKKFKNASLMNTVKKMVDAKHSV